jgi:hypothetical protein
MRAIENAASSVGILATNGIVLAAQKAVTSKLLAPPKTSDKLFTLDEHCMCALAGNHHLLMYSTGEAQRGNALILIYSVKDDLESEGVTVGVL